MRRSPGVFAVGLSILLGLFLFGGCVSYPAKTEIRSQETFKNGYEEVWGAVVGMLEEGNLDIRAMEPAEGTILAEHQGLELRKYVLGRYDSIHCYCVLRHRRHVLGELIGDYAISLSRQGLYRTTVKIDATFRASMYRGGALDGWIPCTSKGLLEPLFLEALEERLEPKKGPPRNLDWWIPRRGY